MGGAVNVFYSNATIIYTEKINDAGLMDAFAFSCAIGKKSDRLWQLPQHNVQYWYGSFILVTGNTKEKNGKHERKRRMFFITKENLDNIPTH